MAGFLKKWPDQRAFAYIYMKNWASRVSVSEGEKSLIDAITFANFEKVIGTLLLAKFVIDTVPIHYITLLTCTAPDPPKFGNYAIFCFPPSKLLLLVSLSPLM